MNWDAIGAIAEIVGAIAVVVTLYYLAMQVRESRLQDLAENTTVAVDRWLEVQTKALDSEEGVAFLRRALNNYQNLSPEEQGRFTSFMFELNAAYQAILVINEKGLLDSRQWVAIEWAMAGHMKCRGASQWWDHIKPNFPVHVRENLDRILAEYEDVPFSELYPYYSPIDTE